MASNTIVWTTGTSVVIPNDFDSLQSLICIAAGGGGARRAAGGIGGSGGGGGGVSASYSVSLTAGATYSVSIGSGGSGSTTSTGAAGGAGGPTWIRTNVTGSGQSAPTSNAAGVRANGGSGGPNSNAVGAGGSITGAYGEFLYAGGNGAASSGATDSGGGGGGSSAYEGNNGYNGGSLTSNGLGDGGSGGGGTFGNGGGTTTATGGTGGLNINSGQASGGSASNGGAGTDGGGGGGGAGRASSLAAYTGGAGGNGPEYTSLGYGGGGGGGGGNSSTGAGGAGGVGGRHGGGGGGGGGGATTGNGGNGGNGAIVLQYNQIAAQLYLSNIDHPQGNLVIDNTLGTTLHARVTRKDVPSSGQLRSVRREITGIAGPAVMFAYTMSSSLGYLLTENILLYLNTVSFSNITDDIIYIYAYELASGVTTLSGGTLLGSGSFIPTTTGTDTVSLGTISVPVSSLVSGDRLVFLLIGAESAADSNFILDLSQSYIEIPGVITATNHKFNTGDPQVAF